MKCLFALLATLVASLTALSQAAAVDIERSDLVTGLDVRPTGIFFDIVDNNQTRLLNTEDCVELFDKDEVLAFYFNLTSTGVDSFRSARVFAAPTDTAIDDFQCDNDATSNCKNIETLDSIFREPDDTLGASYAIEVEFDQLVQEAVSGLEDTNNIQVIQNAEECRTLEVDQQYFIRLLFQSTTGTTEIDEIFDAVIELDTQPPPPPTDITSVAVTENSIFLNWLQEDTPSDMNLNVEQNADEQFVAPFVVYYSNRDFSGESVEQLEAANDVYRSTISLDDPDADGPEFRGEADIKSDTIDTGEEDRVFIAVAARDDVGNISNPLFPGPSVDPEDDGFEPVPVIDFWENYKEAGGQEAGGCSAASGGPMGGSTLLLAAFGLGLFGWRRRRRLRQVLPLAAAALAFGLTTAAAPDASADSPTWGIAEVRLGGYYPSIDDEQGLQGEPFHEIFGGSNRVLVEYEQGFHLVEVFGSFGASASIGYTAFGGDVLLEEGSPLTEEEVNEEAGFMIVPLRAGLYYRFDLLQDRWGIPLVPVVKGGIDYVLWQAEDPSGEASTADGDEGEGGTWGWHASAGLNLLLDWIDPRSAAAMDINWGINNTYAFAEYMTTQVDDFGASDSFDLSDDMWMFGLGFEY